MKRVYFDNAASTPLIPEVKEVIRKNFEGPFANPSAIHSYGREARKTIESCRKKIAQLLGVSIGEIFFCSGATEANNMVLQSSVCNNGINHIISSPLEHHSVLHNVEHLKEHHGVTVTHIKHKDCGRIDYNYLEEVIKKASENEDQKSLVSIMYVNNILGIRNDVARIGELCKTYGLPYHCDAVQAFGKFDVKPKEQGIDYLASSAHKYYGPKGVGFFFMDSSSIIKPLILGGAQERNMRAGTESVMQIEALTTALEWSFEHMQEGHDQLWELNKYFRDAIAANFETVHVISEYDQENFAPHIVNVAFEGKAKNAMLVAQLDINGIAVSGGSACSSGIESDSHVTESLSKEKDTKNLRFSFSVFNTKEEIDYCIEQLKRILG